MPKLCFFRMPTPPTGGYASRPLSIILAGGAEDPVAIVSNVAIPLPEGTDTTGVLTGWAEGTWDKIRFTVVDTAPAVSTITIGGAAYTSGTDYTIAALADLTIVVTTTHIGRTTAVRTFTVDVSAADFDPTDGSWYWIDREDYGGPGACVADGATDNTTALKAVLNAASAAGKNVYVPPAALPYVTGPLTSVTWPSKLYGEYTYANPRPTTWGSKLKLLANAASTMFPFSNISGKTVKYLDVDGNVSNQSATNSRNLFFLSTGATLINFYSCYFHDCGKTTQGGLAIAGDNANYIGVYDCTFYNTANDVEPMANCHHWTVDNNYCSYSIAEALLSYDTGSHDNTFTNNEVVHAGSYGISFNGTYNCVARGNTFTNCKFSVEVKGAASTGNVVDQNTITAGAYSTGSGISMMGGAYDNDFTDNTISGWTDTDGAIRIESDTGAGNTFHGNQITGSYRVILFAPVTFDANTITTGTSHGLSFGGATTGTVLTGNTITGCAGRGINSVDFAQTSITVSGNTSTGNASNPVYFLTGSTGTYTGNTVDGTPVWDGLTAV